MVNREEKRKGYRTQLFQKCMDKNTRGAKDFFHLREKSQDTKCQRLFIFLTEKSQGAVKIPSQDKDKLFSQKSHVLVIVSQSPSPSANCVSTNCKS